MAAPLDTSAQLSLVIQINTGPRSAIFRSILRLLYIFELLSFLSPLDLD